MDKSRKEKVQESLAHLRLEGIEPSAETLQDMLAFGDEKITQAELITKAIARALDLDKIQSPLSDDMRRFERDEITKDEFLQRVSAYTKMKNQDKE